MSERGAALDRGIGLFNAGDFFACHEVLEDEWRAERGPRRFFLQSLIHLAVGFHHYQRGNLAGAAGQLRKGLRKLAGYLPDCEGPDCERIDTLSLYRDATRWWEAVQTGEGCPRFPVIVPSGREAPPAHAPARRFSNGGRSRGI